MKSVVLCGSRRFKAEMREFGRKLKELGVVVFEPYLHSSQEEEWQKLSVDYQKFIALGLTHDHFYKISIADVVFIFNKEGYMGISSTLELGFAMGAKKPVYALSHDEELCRHVLFREIIQSPEELVGKL